MGSDALAGVAVVFPLFLVLQTATASGVGSGVSSAIGRALGAGERARRRRAVLGAAAGVRARALCGDGGGAPGARMAIA
ncbi:MAG: MATE family efflux transporter, partial [Reyranellales bacterium]